MTTKEVAEICGVTEKTVYNNAEKANVVLEHGKAKNWTESSVIKSTVESTFQSGFTGAELRPSTWC